MERTSSRSPGIVPLLFLLLVGATAAAPSAESLYHEARAAFTRGDVKAAGIVASGALERFGDSDDQWVWSLRIVQADVLVNEGKYLAARKLLQRALPARLAGTEIEVQRLQGLALAAYRLNDPTAVTLIGEACELAKKASPRTLPILLVYRATMDERNRMKWAHQALKAAQEQHDVDVELRARGTIALDLANDERFDEALNMWEGSLTQARKAGNQSLVQKLEGNLGWAYLELGDYENAGQFFTRAHATAIRLGIRYDEVPWTYQLGSVRLEQGDLASAERQYRAAYDLAVETKHPQKRMILANLANYELRVGRLVEAQRYCDESLREGKASRDVESQLRSLLIAGRIATATGEFDEAERLLKGVIARTTSPATKLEAQGRLAQLYVKEKCLDSAEAQFLLSIAKTREARENVDGMELRFSFFTAVAELFESYVDFLVASGRNAEALAVTEMSRAQTLEDALPDLAAPRDLRKIAGATGATILCYWLGSTRSYLWIVTPQSVDVVPLPPQRTIEAAVNAYQGDLLGARGSLKMSGARGAELWQMLVGRASRSIPPRSRVIVVPHGRLAAFNMETLVVPTPKPHYWIDDVVLSTAGSLGLLVRKTPQRNATTRLLLVGNAPPPGPEFAALPRAGLEMANVAQHFDPTRSVVLSGAKATPAAYRSKSPGTFTNLHFVAHGVATRLKPLDSAVVLARDGDSFKLYARDIAKQPLTARLVTISSCHGAGTRAYAGEGLVGLGWAFLRAGADNVVAALWDVSDDATPLLMDRFYANLAKDADPATALRDAKLSLVHGEGPYARPYYWAPFLLYGSS